MSPLFKKKTSSVGRHGRASGDNTCRRHPFTRITYERSIPPVLPEGCHSEYPFVRGWVKTNCRTSPGRKVSEHISAKKWIAASHFPRVANTPTRDRVSPFPANPL